MVQVIASQDATAYYWHPQTDGQNVIYTRAIMGGGYQIMLRTPTETVALTVVGSPPQSYYPDRKYYRVANGWTAYLEYTSIGYRLRRRSPAGAFMELSESVTSAGSFGGEFGINALSLLSLTTR